MIPGGNILNMAFSIIAQQTVKYYKFTSRTVTNAGLYVPNYASGIDVSGSLQGVPRSVYQEYGLDLQKNYYQFWTTQDTIDIARDVTGDYFTFNGRKYQLVSENLWHIIDGWTGVLCVDVGAAS